MNHTRISLSVAFGLASTLAVFSARTANAEVGPASDGFFIEGRLSSVNTPGGDGILGGLGGPARAAIGYRFAGASVAVAPAIQRLSVSTEYDEPALYEKRSDAVTLVGAQLIGTVTVSRTANKQGEGYLLGGATLARIDQTSSAWEDNQLVFGAMGGIGSRYFVTPHLACGAELGMGYLGADVDESDSRTESAGIITTWGSVNLQAHF